MPSVSLVLGSGGARGYAHIGVIETLIAKGYEIHSISGCSMGALVGGIFAAGNLAAFKKWTLSLDMSNVFKLVDLSLITSGGMIKGDKVFEEMSVFFGNCRIEELPVKFTAVATDLDGKREIWFQDGDLKTAIRASVAIPTIFTPIYHKGRVLVDGAVLNPLPIAPTMSDHTDLIVAVNLSATYSSPLKPFPQPQPAPQSAIKKTFSALLDKLSLGSKERDSIGQLEIFQRVIEAMQESLTLYKIAGYAPDVLVEVPLESCKSYDFHKAEEMIELGRKLTVQALGEYESFAKKSV